MKTVAIVGAEQHSRHLAPWDDPDVDIWVFNEWASKEWCKRYDLVLQLHPNYQSLINEIDPNHWEWLQQERGIPVYMQEVDEKVPDSVRYPLEEINAEYMSYLTWEGEPLKNFDASLSYAIALALYKGYEKIHIYGVELVHSSTYRSQQSNFAFWAGLAAGRKVNVELHCSRGTFDKPLYGYERENVSHNKLQNYIDGLSSQKEAAQRELNMIEGALQLALQMQADEKEENEEAPKKKKQSK